jgi:hypothetical protein
MKPWLRTAIVLLSIVLALQIAWQLEFISHDLKYCNSDLQKSNKSEDCPIRDIALVQLWKIASLLEKHDGAITALATLVIAAFTFTLWRAISNQGKFTREALVADKRAFVFPTGLSQYWELDPATSRYNWRFRVVWTNSGESPTQHLRSEVSGEVRDTRLPAGFNFNFTSGNDVTGVIPPKSQMQSGVAPTSEVPAVTAQEIVDSQYGWKSIYVYGWIRYSDMLPGSLEHVTRFCWLILSTGDPLAFVPNDPNHALTFAYVSHEEGNCSDNECVGIGLG